MSVIHSKLLPFLAIDALMTQLISGQACAGTFASCAKGVLIA